MFEALAGLASSSGLGAIVGVVGNAVGRWQEAKQERERLAHEAKMRELDMEELRIQHTQELEMADKQLEITETEGRIAADVKDAEAFTESIKRGFQKVGIAWVDAVRSLMRPVISCYLLGVTTYVAVVVFSEVGGVQSLPAERLMEIAEQVIQQVLFLTTVAVTWWFGSRRQGPMGSNLPKS